MDGSIEHDIQVDPEETPKSQAEIASSLFRKVSIKWPASVTAQAIAIALECQVSGENPQELGDALSNDSDRLATLAETANNVHINMRKDKLIRGDGPPTNLTEDIVKRIVESDFGAAANVISFPTDELQKILDMYPHFMQSGNRDERLYTKFAEIRLAEIERKREKEVGMSRRNVQKNSVKRLRLSKAKHKLVKDY